MSRVPPKKLPLSSSTIRRPAQPSHRAPQPKQNGPRGKGHEDGYLYVAGVRDPSKRVTEYRVSVDGRLGVGEVADFWFG